MLLFRYEPQNNYQPTENEIAQMKKQWGTFIGKIAIQEKLISTHQLGFEGKQISPVNAVSEGIYTSERQTLGGNMIVKASSIDEAVEIAKGCPILSMGGRVEVRNILPM